MAGHSPKYETLAKRLDAKLSSAHLPGAELMAISDTIIELITLGERESYIQGVAEGLLMTEIRNGKIKGREAEVILKAMNVEPERKPKKSDQLESMILK